MPVFCLIMTGNTQIVQNCLNVKVSKNFYAGLDTSKQEVYSVGDKTDLDNDGEDERILNGPYGGIYLDARDNRVYNEESADENNPESGMKYTWNGTEISCDEYTELCSKIFASEVSTWTVSSSQTE